MGNFAQGMWNGVVWFFNPTSDTKSIQKSGQTIGQNVQNTVTSAQDLLPTMKNDLEWLIIALVGLLAYVFIFKK